MQSLQSVRCGKTEKVVSVCRSSVLQCCACAYSMVTITKAGGNSGSPFLDSLDHFLAWLASWLFHFYVRSQIWSRIFRSSKQGCRLWHHFDLGKVKSQFTATRLTFDSRSSIPSPVRVVLIPWGHGCSFAAFLAEFGWHSSISCPNVEKDDLSRTGQTP